MPTRKPPTFEEFSARAQEIVRAIPAQFMEGVEAVDVHPEAKRDPVLPSVVLLGECATANIEVVEETTELRSHIHLYYGSFVEMAREDARFDMDAELAETIEHEIQHHVEDRAGVRTLSDADDLFEQHARFKAGLETEAGWYRRGEPMGDHVWAVDLDLFVEVSLRRAQFEALKGTAVSFRVLGEPLEVEIPLDADAQEVFTVGESGLFEPDDLDEEGELPEGEEVDEDTPGTVGDLHIVPLVR